MITDHILVVDLANMFYLCRSKRINDASINGGWPMIAEFFVKFNFWIKTHHPTSIIMLDEGYPHWRYSKLQEYKAGRDDVRQKDPTFEDFRRQRKDIKEQIKKWFPVYFLRHEHLEADDLAYIITKHLRDKKFDGKITAISNDADWKQLVEKVDDVVVWNPRTKETTKKQDINYNFVLYKSLLGDKSDGILGFNKIGEVTAKKFAKDEKLLNEWYNNISDEDKQRLEINKFLIDFKSIPQNYIDETIQIFENILVPRFDSTMMRIYCRERKAWRFLGKFDEKCDNFLSLHKIEFLNN